MNRLVICSNNSHKVEELQAMLPDEWQVKNLKSAAQTIDWDESGDTFEANARIKLAAVAPFFPGWNLLADDSGLVVEALEGRPGVHSSRYAGPQASDAENTNKLLADLSGETNRRAYFVCLLAYQQQDSIQVFRGALHGSIGAEPKGDQGFGFDPIFIPDGSDGRALAEFSPQEKNEISHRYKALLAFNAYLQSLGATS